MQITAPLCIQWHDGHITTLRTVAIYLQPNPGRGLERSFVNLKYLLCHCTRKVTIKEKNLLIFFFFTIVLCFTKDGMCNQYNQQREMKSMEIVIRLSYPRNLDFFDGSYHEAFSHLIKRKKP